MFQFTIDFLQRTRNFLRRELTAIDRNDVDEVSGGSKSVGNAVRVAFKYEQKSTHSEEAEFA